MYVLVNCKVCGNEHFIEVNEKDYENFKNGELAQNAFSYLDADQRELLISGICPVCWDNLFSE